METGQSGAASQQQHSAHNQGRKRKGGRYGHQDSKRGAGGGGEQDNKRTRTAHPGTVVKRKIQKDERGVLITCTPTQEKAAAREALGLFRDFLEETRFDRENDEERAAPSVTSNGASLCDTLASELRDIRAGTDAHEPLLGLLDMVDIGVKGNLFCSLRGQCVGVDPVKLVQSVFERAAKEKSTRARSIVRLIPVLATCSLNGKDTIGQGAKAFFADHFPAQEKPAPFNLLLERKNCQVDRDEIQGAILAETPPNYKLDFKSYSRVFIAQACVTMCFMGVVDYYAIFNKLNLRVFVENCIKRGRSPEEEPDALAQQPEQLEKDSAKETELDSADLETRLEDGGKERTLPDEEQKTGTNKGNAGHGEASGDGDQKEAAASAAESPGIDSEDHGVGSSKAEIE
ncbi:THUMP domain-containing protein 1 [Porphyridium purpureum]|uniref:THUMP domain-containing protein 1 n=1 Tax=Porphyridium purpureum TaxID=35688 RepID=A0A5J4YU48_PORPP|nr:THUMP domain-containing protein 1 [Porphyridium purpureum]|eukprot:POR9231..scf229_5